MTTSLCGAKTRSDTPCTRIPANGKSRCHFHGGAPGSGAQPGNTNAVTHGFYARRQPALADDLQEATLEPLGLTDEICLLRTVLRRSVAAAPLPIVCTAVNTIGRFVMLQRKILANLLPGEEDDYVPSSSPSGAIPSRGQPYEPEFIPAPNIWARSSDSTDPFGAAPGWPAYAPHFPEFPAILATAPPNLLHFQSI